MTLGRHDNFGTTFEGLHPLNLGGHTRSRIWHIFGQLQTLIMNISGMDQWDIVNRKRNWSTTIYATFREKTWWTLIH